MKISINVVNQKLKITSNIRTLVSGSQKFVKFEFHLDDAWDDLLVFAQFIQNGKAYNDFLDKNNCVYLPPEIVAGKFKLLLYGSGSNVIATTNYLTLKVDENAIISDAQSTEITQSLYDQLVTLVQDMDDKIDTITGGTTINNLIDPNLLYTGTTDGVTITREDDTLIFNGTSTSKSRVTSQNLGLEPQKEYIVKVHSESKNQIQFFLAYVGDTASTTKLYTEYNTAITFTVPSGTTSSAFGIQIPSGVTYSNDKFRITIRYATSSAVDTVARASLDAMTTALSTDVGKVLKVKTVTNGKVTAWEFGEAGESGTVDQVARDLLSGMNTASSSDAGKALKAKTVTNGKVTEWEFGEISGTSAIDEVAREKLDEMNAASLSDVGKALVVKSVNNGEVSEWGFGVINGTTPTGDSDSYVTPEAYGAVGDGITDDLSAFQSAISAMSAGDVLYIPAKTYLLSDTLTINKAVTVIGDGTIYVTHASPVIVLDSVDNAVIDLAKIEKSARVFDYEEGSSAYSIAVILKNCGGCNVNIHNILNTTTAFLLLADGTGCHYNQIQCDDAHTFTGIEIVRTSNGGWVNGNRINAFRWMVNTWQDNTDLIPGYMIKSLSYATESENEPYRNNANFFDHLVAEYGAKAADYPILLCRLDYARGYTLHFERSEISPKEASLTNNSFYFTNSTYCVAFVWFSVYSIKSNIGSLGTDHNLIVKKADFEAVSFSGIQSILSSVTLNSNLSYTANWFQIVKNASTKSVRIFGELTVNAELANLSHLIEGLPTCRQGWGTMILTPSITETQWQAAGTVTHYKLSITSGRTFLANVGVIPAGTRLFLDFEYLIAEDDL